jgi:hypothetical protein
MSWTRKQLANIENVLRKIENDGQLTCLGLRSKVILLKIDIAVERVQDSKVEVFYVYLREKLNFQF